MSRPTLDVEALYTAVDRQRRSRRMSWRNVANETSCSASMFTRLGQGLRPDADALLRLLVWLDVTEMAAVSAFIRPAAAEQPEGSGA